MKRSNCIALVPRRCIGSLAIGGLLATLVLSSPAGLADDVVSPAPAASFAPPGPIAVQPGGSQVLAPPSLTPLLAHEGPLAQWGDVSVRPHLSYRLLYGDGLQATSGHPTSTTIQEFSPGILLGLGDHWNLDYTPTWTEYSSKEFRDTLDHYASLAGGTSYGDWTFGFSQNYISNSPVLVETGQQTGQELYATALNTSGHLGMHTLLDLAVSENVRLADAFTGSRELATSDFLHYQFSERLDAGLGFDAGHVRESVGPNMDYVRPEARISWKPTDKISISLQGGNEHRHFDSGGAGSMNSPVYGASVQYQPVETTGLTFGVNRDISVSYIADEITRNSGWTAGVQQRLLKEFYLNATFTHGTTGYVATQTGVGGGRDDRTDALTVRLTTTLFRRGSAAILYDLSHNTSNVSTYRFSSHQVGLELGFRF
jgi:hypothetical protein